MPVLHRRVAAEQLEGEVQYPTDGQRPEDGHARRPVQVEAGDEAGDPGRQHPVVPEAKARGADRPAQGNWKELVEGPEHGHRYPTEDGQVRERKDAGIVVGAHELGGQQRNAEGEEDEGGQAGGQVPSRQVRLGGPLRPDGRHCPPPIITVSPLFTISVVQF